MNCNGLKAKKKTVKLSLFTRHWLIKKIEPKIKYAGIKAEAFSVDIAGSPEILFTS